MGRAWLLLELQSTCRRTFAWRFSRTCLRRGGSLIEFVVWHHPGLEFPVGLLVRMQMLEEEGQQISWPTRQTNKEMIILHPCGSYGRKRCCCLAAGTQSGCTCTCCTGHSWQWANQSSKWLWVGVRRKMHACIRICTGTSVGVQALTWVLEAQAPFWVSLKHEALFRANGKIVFKALSLALQKYFQALTTQAPFVQWSFDDKETQLIRK